MPGRLELKRISDEGVLRQEMIGALQALSKRDPGKFGDNSPLGNCSQIMAAAGARAIVIQTRVQDPDFLAEFSAYYSRQFSDVARYCTRVHFFAADVDGDEQDVLGYLDRVPKDQYLGFVTLRPVAKSPIGASIVAVDAVDGFVRCADDFPVNLAGVEFHVVGTPFMQQDNAVGACAQASIWMALRTLRKREGDRAYDPAQITDAATKYFVSGRIRPNRTGLTHLQMIEAIRAAGYSPHSIPLGTPGTPMEKEQILQSLRTIHAYIESEIPVVLILFPPTGGHAVVAIGHTWSSVKNAEISVDVPVSPDGLKLKFTHAASWVPALLIHNDNTGPYRLFESDPAEDYSFPHAAFAIPLLPVDVFMSAEEAMAVAVFVLEDIFTSFKVAAVKTDAELEQIAHGLSLRLLLVEKRKLRKWAVSGGLPPELSEKIRLMDMPKRVWMLEIHQAVNYGNQAAGVRAEQSLVGMVLIDPTADLPLTSLLLMYFNWPEIINNLPNGIVVTWDSESCAPKTSTQTNAHPAIRPLRG